MLLPFLLPRGSTWIKYYPCWYAVIKKKCSSNVNINLAESFCNHLLANQTRLASKGNTVLDKNRWAFWHRKYFKSDKLLASMTDLDILWGFSNRKKYFAPMKREGCIAKGKDEVVILYGEGKRTFFKIQQRTGCMH